MPVGGGSTNTHGAGCIGKGEAGRSLFRDQIEGCLDQCLAKIAMMVASSSARPVSRPAHVNGFYISRPGKGNAIPCSEIRCMRCGLGATAIALALPARHLPAGEGGVTLIGG